MAGRSSSVARRVVNAGMAQILPYLTFKLRLTTRGYRREWGRDPRPEAQDRHLGCRPSKGRDPPATSCDGHPPLPARVRAKLVMRRILTVALAVAAVFADVL